MQEPAKKEQERENERHSKQAGKNDSNDGAKLNLLQI